jgi:hypothetical protein
MPLRSQCVSLVCVRSPIDIHVFFAACVTTLLNSGPHGTPCRTESQIANRETENAIHTSHESHTERRVPTTVRGLCRAQGNCCNHPVPPLTPSYSPRLTIEHLHSYTPLNLAFLRRFAHLRGSGTRHARQRRARAVVAHYREHCCLCSSTSLLQPPTPRKRGPVLFRQFLSLVSRVFNEPIVRFSVLLWPFFDFHTLAAPTTRVVAPLSVETQTMQ